MSANRVFDSLDADRFEHFGAVFVGVRIERHRRHNHFAVPAMFGDGCTRVVQCPVASANASYSVGAINCSICSGSATRSLTSQARS